MTEAPPLSMVAQGAYTGAPPGRLRDRPIGCAWEPRSTKTRVEF